MMQTTINKTESVQVNRLLRCRKTQRYFNGGGWTADLTLAKNFDNQFDAVHECIRHSLVDVDLVLRVPGGASDLFTTAVR